MASISNIKVTSGDTVLISEGTGTYDPESRLLVCVGKWETEPAPDAVYAVDFESIDGYGQPFDKCRCTDFEKGGETTGTFVSEE